MRWLWKLLPWEPEKHEKFVLQWWYSRKGIDFPLRFLPEIGFVAYNDERTDPVAAIFLYTTNSAVAWITWPISNPEAKTEERDECLDLLFYRSKQVAQEQGFSYLFTTTGVPALAERMERLGYIKGDENVTQYIKEIG